MAGPKIPCCVPSCDRKVLATGLCARHYFRKREGRPLQTECANCGAATDRPRFCSVRCSQIARDRRNGVRAFTPAEQRQCVVCDVSFARPKKGSDDARLCCSRACGFTLIRWRGEQSRSFHEAKADFARWADVDRVLGFKVRIDALKRRLERKLRPCPTCGEPIGHALYKRYCSPTCYRFDPEARRRSSRTAKARRRAIERGSHAERFDPIEVLNRDGWRCHICGVKTPKRLRGSYDDRAPELDHIVPLAVGGKHTRINTACACRRCNIKKGSNVRGQLRLVA